MNRTMLTIILALGIFFPLCSTSAQEKSSLKDALALQEAMQEAIKKAEPSIACILVARERNPRERNTDKLKDPENVPDSYGSGVVIGTQDGRGLILTNFHVVQGDNPQFFVRLPGGKGSYAERYAADYRSDLAVLRLADPIGVQAIKMGDGDQVQKGQFVISLANPFAAGFQDGSPSASWGIVSNLRRKAPGKPPAREGDRAKLTIHHLGTLLQIDARLNLGCSGGALIDLKGELIGLTSSQAAITGGETPGGYAVPMNSRVQKIVDQLRDGKEVSYGFLGVQFLPDNWRGQGVSVRVIPGSPIYRNVSNSERVVIRSVDGIPLRDSDDLLYAISTRMAGSKIKLEIAGVAEPVTVTLLKLFAPGPII
ncbi:MAG TPA: trypsin-like peptidase domain-containing protein, partial [Gemmataceae bacterium]|nr:trypsin-like peptidase domain-containing protein [Gemmataceae bacterium]